MTKGILFHQAAERVRPFVEAAERRTDEAWREYEKAAAVERAIRAQRSAHYEAAHRAYRSNL